jgi:hypothetical protein
VWLVCLLPISSVWLGLGLGCVAGHNYNQQRSPEQGKVVTERRRHLQITWFTTSVETGGLFNTWGGSSCRGGVQEGVYRP